MTEWIQRNDKDDAEEREREREAVCNEQWAKMLMKRIF